MANSHLPPELAGAHIHLVGIKGTGLSALAELLQASHVDLSGSDTNDHFYTDEILTRLGIPYAEDFDAKNLKQDCELVIHSAAYTADNNAELAEAARRGLPVLKYPDALGELSGHFDSCGICGVHGKTTTTALAGSLCQALDLPARVLVGSAVSNFGDRSTLNLGDRFFIAETCEYRRHFMAFHPRRIVLTSVESDHQDYFPTYESIRDAFVDYICLLPPGGELIYCADDPGAVETVGLALKRRPDIKTVPYGFTAPGPFGISSFTCANERTVLRLRGFDTEFRLRVSGRHVALDATAAFALISSLVSAMSDAGWTPGQLSKAVAALEAFRGSRRRSEIVGEKNGILVMDDYGHHPTAIRTTLEGLREFYPGRRIVLSFMSHTYTRTAALLEDFASSFSAADLVFLHKIYASAREKYSGGVTGETLAGRARAHHPAVRYVEEPEAALDELLGLLRPGDLFLTMGAGDNWKLGREVLSALERKA